VAQLAFMVLGRRVKFVMVVYSHFNIDHTPFTLGLKLFLLCTDLVLKITDSHSDSDVFSVNGSFCSDVVYHCSV
jgi:hypothetical protein